MSNVPTHPSEIDGIAGLTDARQLQRGGFLRLGEPMSGRQYPQKIDYFRLETERADFAAAFQDRYGDRPKAIPVVFPSNNRAVVFPQAYSCYRGSKMAGANGKRRGVLVCKGNGVSAVRLNEGRKLLGLFQSRWQPQPCPGGDECEWYAERKCRRVARLQVLAYELPSWFVLQVNTTSVYSIINVNTALDMLQRVRGTIAFVPVILRLVPEQVTYLDSKNNQRKAAVIYTLKLDIDKPLPEMLAQPSLTTVISELAPPDEECDTYLHPPAVIEPEDDMLEQEVAPPTVLTRPATVGAGDNEQKEGGFFE